MPSKTSRALLAVAFTAPSESWRASGWKGQPSAVSKAIISSTKAGASFGVILGELHFPCDASPPDRYNKQTGEVTNDIEKETRKRFRYCYRGYSEYPPPSSEFSELRHVDSESKGDATSQLKEYYDAQWEILDFADIDSFLSAKLTDDDIGAILLCIDAKHHLSHLQTSKQLQLCRSWLGTTA